MHTMGWKKYTATRLLPSLGVLLSGIFLARSVWLATAGVWFAQENLVYSLSTTVPGWAKWNFYGARSAQYTADPLMAWFSVVIWTVTVWLAGLSRDKIERPILLMSALLGAVICVGAGDAVAAVVMPFAVAITWLVLWLTSDESPSFKPMYTAFFMGGLAFFGTQSTWAASFPGEPDYAFLSIGFLITSGLGLGGAFLITRMIRNRPVLCGVFIGAVFAAVWYTGPVLGEAGNIWSLRRAGATRLTESAAWHLLRQELTQTRLSEKEASVQRLVRPEAGTVWEVRQSLLRQTGGHGEEGLFLASWLTTDAAIYSGATGQAREDLRMNALARMKLLPSTPVTHEFDAWIELDAGRFDTSCKSFRTALDIRSDAPMCWLGLALAEAGAGRDNLAAKSLSNWCLLDPRAVFSPAWSRSPLKRLRTESMRLWQGSLSELTAGGSLSSRDARRLLRFSGWFSAWTRAEGDVAKFLNDRTESFPVAGSVFIVRERMGETLANPSDEKIGAIISAGAALLCDRHMNLGQCHEVFDWIRAGSPSTQITSMRGGFSGKIQPERLDFFAWSIHLPRSVVMISRPMVAGWNDVCRVTEGGVGAVFHDFEENIVMRMLTYGHEISILQIPDTFLRRGLLP